MNALKAIAAVAAGVAIVAVCVLVWLAGVALLESLGDDDPEPPQQSAVQILRKLHSRELSDWDRLTLAIALTESHCNPAAEGSAQAEAIRRHNPGAGPGYAAEVRRNLQLVERYEAVRAAILSKQ